MSLPIKDEVERAIIDIAKNDCLRYVKEFGPFDIVLTAELPLNITSNYTILNKTKMNIFEQPPIGKTGEDKVDKFISPIVKEVFDDLYNFDIDESLSFWAIKVSKMIPSTSWVIIPFNTFEWVNPVKNNMSYDSLISTYLKEYSDSLGIDPNNVGPITPQTISILKSDPDFDAKFRQLISKVNFKQPVRTGTEVYGYSSQEKYLAIRYHFYSSHWLHSKIMRPGAISKLMY
jgi:hypothetical protein